MKKLVVLLLMVVASYVDISAQSSDVKFGLGWYSTTAPIGGRLWVTRFVGVDLGLGYANSTEVGGDDARVHVNAGVIINAYRTKENVNFFVRPGVEFRTNSRLDEEGELTSKMILTLDLGAEWYITDNFSLSVGHGFQFQQVNGTSDMAISTRALSFENVGFHFYF